MVVADRALREQRLAFGQNGGPSLRIARRHRDLRQDLRADELQAARARQCQSLLQQALGIGRATTAVGHRRQKHLSHGLEALRPDLACQGQRPGPRSLAQIEVARRQTEEAVHVLRDDLGARVADPCSEIDRLGGICQRLIGLCGVKIAMPDHRQIGDLDPREAVLAGKVDAVG